MMKEIDLDATHWETRDDFYDDFFRAVGAPSWHGRNFNALRDSIVTGSINEIELPYTIRIFGIEMAPAEVKSVVTDFCSLIKEFRAKGMQLT